MAISLIILLVLTIIGVSAMNTTLHEEKMTGNLREQQVAFQCAEAALPKIINSHIGKKKASNFDSVIADPGFYGLLEDKPANYFANSLWEDEAGIITDVVPGVDARFIIEILENAGEDNVQQAENANLNGDGLSGSVYAHRITVRCTGQTGNAVAMIQAYYGAD
ncbi:MAG: PilX N-terminal domain-containing pilus assembly protein [Pseudomonadota bacterium]